MYWPRLFDSLPNIQQGNTFIKEVFKMCPGEVLVTKEDKDKILEHWNYIMNILNKYDRYSEPTNVITNMSNVKSTAYKFSILVDRLSVIE